MPKLSAQEKNAIPEKLFAFPAQRKEPLENANHVRNAIARFNQVQGVSDRERDEAWSRIVTAAKHFGVELHKASWHDLFVKSLKTRRPPYVHR